MFSNSFLAVFPDNILFRDFVLRKTETSELRVLNKSTNPLKIRFFLSANSVFKLSKNGQFNIPPGIEFIQKVSFKPTSETPNFGAFKDIIKIETPSGTVSIPISAYPPAPRISVDQNRIDLSGVPVNSDRKFAFKITNVGVDDAKYNLKIEEQAIHLNPSSGVLKPSETVTINGVFSPKTIDVFDTKIDILCDKLLEKIEPIKFTGSSVNNSISVLLNGKPFSNLDFDIVFFGQKKVIQATIMNNSNEKRSFVIIPPVDSALEGSNKKSKSAEKFYFSRKHYTFLAEPFDGVLNPLSSMQVNFIFQPIVTEENSQSNFNLTTFNPDDDFETDFDYSTAIEIPDTSQKIEFQLVGKAVRHFVSVPVVDFDFGELLVNQKSSKPMEIRNNSQHLSIQYEIKDVANFRFVPNKGVIKKNSSITINIVFFPKALGCYEISPSIIFGNGIFKQPFNCVGNCVQKIQAPKFVREPIFSRDENARFNYFHPDLRYQYTPEQTQQIMARKRQYDAYITDSARTRQQRAETKNFISQTRKLATTMFRNSNGEIDEDEVRKFVRTKLDERGNKDDEVTLGIETGEGLKPPEPPLIKRSDHFSTQSIRFKNKSFNVATNDLNNTGKSLPFNENETIKKKFKPTPTTPTEGSDCAKILTPAQKLLIDVSHQTINFGEIGVHSTVTKSFTVTNNLDQFILVSFNTGGIEELQNTYPLSQVIPAKQTAGFDIKYNALKPCIFEKTIEYSINSNYTLPLKINATVVPIDLQLSRNQIEFRFSPGIDTPIIKENITINNKSSITAKFSWLIQNPLFSISKPIGFVESKKSITLEISYTPKEKNKDEAILTMNVDGGPSRALKCIGLPGSPRCVLSKKSVDFGLVPVGMPRTEIISLKNSGGDDAIFTITNPNLSELSIQPLNGRVNAHESQTFEITFKSVKAHSINYSVDMEIAGTQPLNFLITGQSEIPKVKISVSEFDFGKIFVGSSISKTATLKNVGKIPAVLFLNLSSKPEFQIEYSSDLAQRNSYDDLTCNSISLVSDQFFITSELNENALLGSINEVESNIGSLEKSNNNGLIYKIVLIENSSMDLNFVFQPTEVKSYSFIFPLSILNVASSEYNIQPPVYSESVKAPISVSSNIIDFPISPIYDPQNPHARPASSIIKIYNEKKIPIKWRLGSNTQDPKQIQAFNFEPQNGVLNVGQTTTIHFNFVPRAQGPYHIYIPLYACNEKLSDSEDLISQILLTGLCTPLNLKLSHSEVFIPPVPLGMSVQKTIKVINHAFIDSTLKVEMLFEKNICPLEVTFPEGNHLTSTTIELPILITFKSDNPTSFSTIIAVIDDKGNAASFKVTCTSDNSIFTLYSFVQSLESKMEINILADGSKPIYLDTKKIDKSKLAKTPIELFSSADDIFELKHIKFESIMEELKYKSVSSFIVQYLNSLVLNSQIKDFPNDIIKNDFSIFVETISSLNGGKILLSNLSSDRSSSKFEDSLMRRRENAKKIINQLQTFGALLSSIKPEFLLPKADFLHFMKKNIEKKQLGIDYINAPDINSFDQKILCEYTSTKSYSTSLVNKVKILEYLYPYVSFESWMIVYFQVFKLFVVGKIKGEKIGSLPGVSETLKQLKSFGTQNMLLSINRPIKNLSLSNVFNSSECGLLKWASIYLSKFENNLISPVTDFKNLRDSICFNAIINSHANRYFELPYDYYSHGNSNDGNQATLNEQNANQLINSMKSMRFAFIPNPEDIYQGNRLILAIIAAYLCEIMPHYISKTRIEFVTPLHQSLLKTFSLSNQSKVEITYQASINDTENFHLPCSQILIGPNKSYDFPIEFFARTSKPIHARLELIPNKSRSVTTDSNSENKIERSTTSKSTKFPHFSAPVVVDIVTKVLFESPDFSFSHEGQIYQSTKLKIPVKNVLNKSSNFKVKSYELKVTDEYDKEIKGLPELKDIIQELMTSSNDSDENEFLHAYNKLPMIELLKKHKAFHIYQNEVNFDDSNDEKELDIDFIPISLGKYNLIILLVDENNGEIIVEVSAKTALPQSLEVSSSKLSQPLKTTANTKVISSFPVELENQNLVKAIAYSLEMSINLSTYRNERKFREQLNKRTREVENIYKNSLSNQKFVVVNSASPYFHTSTEFTLYSSKEQEDTPQNKNQLTFSFKPSKAGQYPCHLLLVSQYDTRSFQINGIGLAETRKASIDFSTCSGKEVIQDIPLQNPSDELWVYKIAISGNDSNLFSFPDKISVKPKETATLPIRFMPYSVGNFSAELQLFNQNKENTIIYSLLGDAEEPPAESKIVINCQAKHELVQTLNVNIKPFLKSKGPIEVTSTVPIISFSNEFNINKSYSFEDDKSNNSAVSKRKIVQPFEFTILAPRSGLSVGTITFTDTQTNSFVWYILEIHVDSPEPEQTIDITTTVKKSTTVLIPITNPKKDPVTFMVSFSDSDVFGEKEFVVNPGQQYNYKITVIPLKEMKRISSICFFSENDGEFWYSLNIEAKNQPETTLAPLSAPLGKTSSAFVTLENPLEKTAQFRVENDNQSSFTVIGKRVINVPPKEKKRVEIKYIPSGVGAKDTATISFISKESGENIYHLTGTGKPPPPLSPVIVSTPKDSINSALIIFTNPFPYSCRFSISMSCECGDVFNFLAKRKVFTLNSYGEEYQIAFSFSPRELGQYKAHVVIASLGSTKGPLPDLESMPSARWIYPIIGNALSESMDERKSIRCRSMTTVDEELTFVLIGETEVFTINKYSASITLPPGYEFLNTAISIRTKEIKRKDNIVSIVMTVRFSPQKPLKCIATISIKNPLSQEWHFDIELTSERGKVISQVIVESLLNKTGYAKVHVPFTFNVHTNFRAYFAQGSAIELDVQPRQGTIEPSFLSPTELPVTVLFSPKMYGKVLKGILVIETETSQYLFEVLGKTPEYVPPDLSTVSAKINNKLPEEVQKFHLMQTKKHRNIIKDNIENVKTARRTFGTSKKLRT